MKWLIVCIAIIVLALVINNFQNIADFFSVGNSPESQHLFNFSGYRLYSRSPMEEAVKTPVYPNEQALKDIFYNKSVYRIRLAFIPNESINGYYGVVSYGLAVKMPIIIQNKTGKSVIIESFPVNSTEEAKSYSSPRGPIILMLPPWQSNRTAVTIDGYLILLEGSSFDETNRDYFDLDLAADKLILTLMEQYETSGG